MGVAATFVLIGIPAGIALAPSAWAVDAQRNLAAADALLSGTFGSVEGYRYPPLAAMLTVPFTALPAPVAIGAWLLRKVVVLAVGVLVVLRGRPAGERVAALVVTIAFLPILYDLGLGNVTVVVIAALAIVAWCDDGFLAGVPLGLDLANAPKPQLVFVLRWMALFRRRALGGAAAMAIAATGLAVLVVGPSPYLAWLEALRSPAYLQGDYQAGNSALTTLPMPAAVAAALTALAAGIMAVRRGPWPGFAATLCLGLLVSPYTLAYSAGVLLVAVPALWLGAPRVLVALALAAPFGVVLALPVWVGAVLAAVVLLPRDAWRLPGCSSSADRNSPHQRGRRPDATLAGNHATRRLAHSGPPLDSAR